MNASKENCIKAIAIAQRVSSIEGMSGDSRTFLIGFLKAALVDLPSETEGETRPISQAIADFISNRGATTPPDGVYKFLGEPKAKTMKPANLLLTKGKKPE